MRQDLQCHILDYLRRHPDARDSAEGIMTWWVPPITKVTLTEIEETLRTLVVMGWVRRTGEGNVNLFGLETTALTEIQAFLEQERRRG